MLRDGDAIHASKNDLNMHISYTSTALNLDLYVRASKCRSKSHDSTSPRHIIQPTESASSVEQAITRQLFIPTRTSRAHAYDA